MAEFSVRRLVDGAARGRRLVTVPAMVGAAGVLGVTAPLWAPAAAALDLVQQRRGLPRVRALSIATGWTVLEAVGLTGSVAIWAAGKADDADTNYVLQRWWAERLVQLTGAFGGLRFEVDHLNDLAPGPIVMAPRHASIADSLVPVWLLAQCDMRPRYVLKRELLLDPCLDIIGNRTPNHFVVRDGDDTARELGAITQMAMGMDHRDGAVVYPEGTVANDARRRRALQRIAERDPARAERLTALRVMMPTRTAGLWAALEGSPEADLVLVGHVGLEAVSAMANVPTQVPLRSPVRVLVRRIERASVPDDRAEFTEWFDARWLDLDRELAAVGE
jgi:1-acyl-sn-glycerol-3-phosphate acyltransferase